MTPAEAITALERVAAREVGRGSERLASHTVGALRRAAESIGAASRLDVSILTGFYIPAAEPPAAETDGPLGAVQLAAAVGRLGGTARLVTDEAVRARRRGGDRGGGNRPGAGRGTRAGIRRLAARGPAALRVRQPPDRLRTGRPGRRRGAAQHARGGHERAHRTAGPALPDRTGLPGRHRRRRQRARHGRAADRTGRRRGGPGRGDPLCHRL